MTKMDRDYDRYVALSPEDRMHARLQGLTEVIGAAGLDVLSEADLRRVASDPAEGSVAPRLSAFGETAAVFIGGVEKAGEPITLDEAGQAALAERLGISIPDLRAAITATQKKP